MVRRSPGLAVVLVLAHVSTLALIWLLTLPITLHLGLKVALLGSLLWSLRKAGWLGARTHPFRLRVLPADQATDVDRVEIEWPSGRVQRASIVEGSLVLSSLIILRCRVEGSPWWRPHSSWLLPPDSVPADAHRQLRVRLRWGRAAPV